MLLAVCRPYKHDSLFAKPVSNAEITKELVLNVGAVKTRLREMFAKLNLSGLPQNEKSVRLVEEAFGRGLVRDTELEDDRSRADGPGRSVTRAD